MPTKLPQRDPIAAAKRKSVANRRVGNGSKCAFCGENRPAALITGSNPTICEECMKRRKGKSTFDHHHVAGKANHSLTIPIPANDHRAILSEAQYDWPKATVENAYRSPLLAVAACIRGIYDTIEYLLNQLLLWAAEFVELLDAFLVSHFGPKWWTSRKYIEFKNRRSE
jgi:hypothetical protein